MKHLLNNLSEEEKQSILEQHNGGMKVFSENFKRLIGHKSGTILNEGIFVYFKDVWEGNKEGTIHFNSNGIPTEIDGIAITDYNQQVKPYVTIFNVGGRGFEEGTYDWVYSSQSPTGRMGENEKKEGVVFKRQDRDKSQDNDIMNGYVGSYIF